MGGVRGRRISVSLRPVGLQSEFQNSQCYIERPCLGKTKKPKNPKSTKQKNRSFKCSLALSMRHILQDVPSTPKTIGSMKFYMLLNFFDESFILDNLPSSDFRTELIVSD